MVENIRNLVFVGLSIHLIGIVFYIKEILRGNIKPNKLTWLLWAISPLIATAAAISDGVRLSILPTFMAGFGPLIVFITSFMNKDAYWELGKFDYLCGFFSALALILWGITKEPSIAIAFLIVSDGFAAVPTLIKAWKHPETENAAPYLAEIFSALTSFAAIEVWNFSSAAFPTYLVILDTLLALSIYKGRIFKWK
ncbi:MAG: hypothetical protein ACM3UU_08255 [Ignavibacteriales bacterium]